MTYHWRFAFLGLIAGACAGEAFSSADTSGPDLDASGADAGDDGSTDSGRAGADASADAGQKDGSATGGTSGTGGGTGGMPADVCPAQAPPAGSSCAHETLFCEYGVCCKTQATCSGGSWFIGQGECAAAECPVSPPVSQAACECEPGLQCVYDQCADAGNRLIATCDDAGRWTSSASGCADTTFECGPSRCVDGQVCVTTISLGAALTYRCTNENPCGDQPVQCSCASELCDGMLCTDSPGPNVLCGAP
jgi:GH24 family phage-related lysozyme (muramidase)